MAAQARQEKILVEQPRLGGVAVRGRAGQKGWRMPRQRDHRRGVRMCRAGRLAGEQGEQGGRHGVRGNGGTRSDQVRSGQVRPSFRCCRACIFVLLPY